ncbi:hypothetical protein CPAL_25850 [Clostridium thermopalmarium DSM 5974]|uniref:Uncharacterized protein n=2 Tax=Clostridium TaxID=1485 RepID=A0A2T0AKH1_9CLOT|nr:hypothetical protein CPAL_25850 [Clostridium thermopalmarium DSM 5974]
MTAVCTTYILIAPEGFKLSMSIGLPVGIVAAVAAITGFLTAAKRVSARQSAQM